MYIKLYIRARLFYANLYEVHLEYYRRVVYTIGMVKSNDRGLAI